jgi:fructokinase
MFRFGVDLGGTKIAAIALASDGAVLATRRVPTPRQDYEGTVAAIAGLVADAERSLGAGAASVFGVILGTGTGGGLVIDGRVQTGPNAIAGEWGHNPLPWPDEEERPGPACYCGQTGCIETFLSGPGLAADYRRRGGGAVAAEEVVARAPREPLANASLRAWTRRVAKALATVINVVDPDVIVVGGGLSQVVSIYTDVPKLWGAWVFSDTVVTRFVASRYGDASGVRGAAWLWS